MVKKRAKKSRKKVEDLRAKGLPAKQAKRIKASDGTSNTIYVSTAGGGVWKTRNTLSLSRLP